MSLFSSVIDIEKVRAKKFLEEMEESVPWEWAIEIIEPYYKRKSNLGRPQTEIKTLLKMMSLQQWYNLSDESVEDQATDRISFRQFLGLSEHQKPIDATTICKFRKLLEEHKIQKKIQEKFTQRLKDIGIILQEGTAVDATIINTSSSTKNKDKKRDQEMGYTKKNNQNYFGGKVHISQDQKTKLIKRLRFTPANVHDSKVFEQLLDSKEKGVFADKGYVKKSRKQKLRKLGIFCGITLKGSKKHKLTKSHKKQNRQWSSARAGVEFPFGVWKHLWGHRKLRYKGIRKNSEQFHFLAFLSNCYTINQKNLSHMLTG